MKTILIFFSTLIFGVCVGQKSAIYNTSAGAIGGYDPVAYFVKKAPVKGSAAFTYVWKDAKWYFATARNRDTFKNSPKTYAPQYGGYCSYAVSKGRTAKTDPNAWKIVGGKLYLNYGLTVKKHWEAHQKEYIKKADANWPEVLKK